MASNGDKQAPSREERAMKSVALKRLDPSLIAILTPRIKQYMFLYRNDLKSERSKRASTGHILPIEGPLPVEERRIAKIDKRENVDPTLMEDLTPTINQYVQQYRHEMKSKQMQVYKVLRNSTLMAFPKADLDITIARIVKMYMRKFNDENRSKSCDRHDKKEDVEEGSPLMPPLNRASLFALLQGPVRCPIGDCKLMVGSPTLLHHYLAHHCVDIYKDLHEVFNGTCSSVIFDANNLEYGQNQALCLFMYAGRDCVRPVYPAECGISAPNCFLTEQFDRYRCHLPVILMACMTSKRVMRSEESCEDTVANVDDEDQNLLVFWFMSLPTTKPIFVTMNVYNKAMSHIRSAVIRVRSLHAVHDPNTFMQNETSFMDLTSADIKKVTNDRRGKILLEVVLNTYGKD